MDVLFGEQQRTAMRGSEAYRSKSQIEIQSVGTYTTLRQHYSGKV